MVETQKIGLPGEGLFGIARSLLGLFLQALLQVTLVLLLPHSGVLGHERCERGGHDAFRFKVADGRRATGLLLSGSCWKRGATSSRHGARVTVVASPHRRTRGTTGS